MFISWFGNVSSEIFDHSRRCWDHRLAAGRSVCNCCWAGGWDPVLDLGFQASVSSTEVVTPEIGLMLVVKALKSVLQTKMETVLAFMLCGGSILDCCCNQLQNRGIKREGLEAAFLTLLEASPGSHFYFMTVGIPWDREPMFSLLSSMPSVS